MLNTSLAESLTQPSLKSIGNIKSREPQRFYSYALLDPKDKPFAHFRYRCLAHGMFNNPGEMDAATDMIL